MGKELGDLSHVANVAKKLLKAGKPVGYAARIARESAEARAGWRAETGELNPEFLTRAEQSILKSLRRHFEAL